MCVTAGACLWLLLYGACYDGGFDWRVADPPKLKFTLKVRWGPSCASETTPPKSDDPPPGIPVPQQGPSAPDRPNEGIRLPDTKEE